MKGETVTFLNKNTKYLCSKTGDCLGILETNLLKRNPGYLARLKRQDAEEQIPYLYLCRTYESFKKTLEKRFIQFCNTLGKRFLDGEVSIPGKIVPGYTDNINAILAGANGDWA